MPQQPPSDLYATAPPPDLYGDKPPKDTSFLDSVSSYIPQPVKSAADWATKPLVDLSKYGKQFSDEVTEPSSTDQNHPWEPYVRGFIGGAGEGLSNVASSLTTPLNLATMGSFKGASTLAKSAPTIARGLRYAGGALSSGIAAHGAVTAADPNQPLSNRLFAIPETAAGIIGMHSGFSGPRPQVKPNLAPGGVQPDTAASTNQAIIEARQRADAIIKSPNSNELLKPEEIPAAKARYDELYQKGINDPTNFTMGEAKEGIKLYDKLKAVNFGKSGIPGAEDDLVQKPPDPNFPGNARFAMEPNEGVTPPPPVIDPEAQAVRDQTAKQPNASPEFDPSTLNLEPEAPPKGTRAKPSFKNGIRQPAQEYPGFKGVVPDEEVAGHDEAANDLTSWIRKLVKDESGELDLDSIRRAFTRETSKVTAGPEPDEGSEIPITQAPYRQTPDETLRASQEPSRPDISWYRSVDERNSIPRSYHEMFDRMPLADLADFIDRHSVNPNYTESDNGRNILSYAFDVLRSETSDLEARNNEAEARLNSEVEPTTSHTGGEHAFETPGENPRIGYDPNTGERINLDTGEVFPLPDEGSEGYIGDEQPSAEQLAAEREESWQRYRKEAAQEAKRKTLDEVEASKKIPAKQRLSKLIGEDRANQLTSGEKVIEADQAPFRRGNKKVLNKTTIAHWADWGDRQLAQETPDPGKPGIEVKKGITTYFPNEFKIIYRDEAGNPIGVLKTNMSGDGISTLAASSKLGLRRGKVAFEMLKHSFDMGVNEPSGATSDMTKNLIDRVKRLVKDETGELDLDSIYSALNDMMGGIKKAAGKFFSDESGSVDPAVLSRLSALFEKQKTGALSPDEMTEAASLAKQVTANGGLKATALKNKDVIGAAAGGNKPPSGKQPIGKQPIPEGAEFPQGNTADPVLAKSVKYAPESQFLNKLSGLSSKTARMVLGTHIPGTAYSFHGLNVAVRNTIFGPDFNPINAGGRFIDTVKYLSSPNKANAYLVLNEAELAKAVKDGGLRATTTDVGNNAMFRGSNLLTKGINALTDPKPLFGKVIPALKLKSYQGLLDQYQKAGMPYDKAAKLAGYATNNIFGGLNLQALERNPTTQKLFRLAALAPDWMESNVRLGQGMAQSLKNPSDPAGRVYQVGMANFLGSYVALNVLSAINNNGKFMFQNEPGHEFDVAMGQDSKGRTRYFAPYGTAMDMLRVPLAIGNAAYTKGDLGQAFREIKNRTSEPGQIVGDLLYNEDYKQSPIYGKEKYGNKMMPASKQLGNIATNTAGHVVPIGANSLLDYMMGNISPEQLALQGFQLPFKYKFPERHKIR